MEKEIEHGVYTDYKCTYVYIYTDMYRAWGFLEDRVDKS